MKRLVDLVVALVLALPVLAFVAILSLLIWAIDGYSPFFPQRRLGKNGRMFTCYKLQTMRPAKDMSEHGVREKDADRTTPLGAFIRNHGWDELPQIVNVIKGTMSFVGPRPLLAKTYERIREKNCEIASRVDAWQSLREEVRSGVSGWHQVQIGKRVSMIDCDLEYLQRPTLSMRTRIVLTTIAVFFLGKAHYAHQAG